MIHRDIATRPRVGTDQIPLRSACRPGRGLDSNVELEGRVSERWQHRRGAALDLAETAMDRARRPALRADFT